MVLWWLWYDRPQPLWFARFMSRSQHVFMTPVLLLMHFQSIFLCYHSLLLLSCKGPCMDMVLGLNGGIYASHVQEGCPKGTKISSQVMHGGAFAFLLVSGYCWKIWMNSSTKFCCIWRWWWQAVKCWYFFAKCHWWFVLTWSGMVIMHTYLYLIFLQINTAVFGRLQWCIDRGPALTGPAVIRLITHVVRFLLCTFKHECCSMSDFWQWKNYLLGCWFKIETMAMTMIIIVTATDWFTLFF